MASSLEEETAAALVGEAAADNDDVDRELVVGYVSLRHCVTAIGRSGMAYSNARRLWWPLAYLELPMLWALNAVPIAHRPGELVTLGRASAQLADRDQRVFAVDPPPRARRLLLALIVLDYIVLLGAPLWIAQWSYSPPLLLAAAAWLLLLVALPLVVYGIPALIQQRSGRGLAKWKKATRDDTHRQPVSVSQLGAWPCTGGGQKGNGDGFKLMCALAAKVRDSDQIMVGVARGQKLATKYIPDTGAEASRDNPRHLRWP